MAVNQKMLAVLQGRTGGNVSVFDLDLGLAGSQEGVVNITLFILMLQGRVTVEVSKMGCVVEL